MATYDYERTRRTASHVWVEKGALVQVSNVVNAAKPPSVFYDCVVEEALEYQLYDEHGAAVRQSYRGPGEVASRGSKKALIIGDPQRHANLLEYEIDDKPTPESLKRYEAVLAGVTAAIGDFKPRRRLSAKGRDWLRGYDEAMTYRRLVVPK